MELFKESIRFCLELQMELLALSYNHFKGLKKEEHGDLLKE
jgi:hypothetical protein